MAKPSVIRQGDKPVAVREDGEYVDSWMSHSAEPAATS